MENNIDHTLHDRVEAYYNVHRTLPKFIPVTYKEYHLLENKFNYSCLCWDKVARKRRPIVYQIGVIKMKVDIQEGIVRKLKEHGMIEI